jgi:DNA-directed RNA polymerase subunit RPC12/RpoP
MDAPREVTCPECGGTAHLITHPPDEGFEPGDVAAYVCEDCDHRLDIVLEETEEGPYAP